MAKAVSSTIPSGNHLLASLPPGSYNRLLRHLRPVRWESGQVVAKARAPFPYVYFPVWGVASFLAVMENGDSVEVGTVGNEGMVGVGGVLEAPYSINQVIVQVPGEALRGETGEVQKEVDRDVDLHSRLTAYQTAFQAQVAQSVACNGLHPIDKRCCRWLLMTHDRVGAEVLPITHEYLSYMLGVRRASVTDVLGPLCDRGLIANARGAITILDRLGLEAASCECYRSIRDEYERLLGRDALRNFA